MNVRVEPWPAAQRFANSPHSSGESGFTSASWFKIVSAPFTCGSCANREPLTATATSFTAGRPLPVAMKTSSPVAALATMPGRLA